MREPIFIDGAVGEGGGQILRTSLALSLVTGRPVRIERIRARRPKPGLLRQHLTAVRAAAEVCGGETRGAELGATALSFTPGAVRPGEYRFAVGTAGSATLVLQTILPGLATASAPSRLVLEGGTHNPFAPPWDFLARAFLPLLRRMGPQVDTRLERYGFYPAGGGRFTVEITPAPALVPIDLLERGPLRARRARGLVANLAPRIAERELDELAQRLGLTADEQTTVEVEGSPGPGNVVMLDLEHENVTEVFTGFGQKGVLAERVADDVADEARPYLALDVPVGPHLADQLLVPFALAGGGRFRTGAPTRHTHTNAEVIRRFLDVEIVIRNEGGGAYEVSVGGRPGGEK